MFPKFQHAIANRFAITEAACLQPPEANPKFGLGLLVAHRLKPFCHWLLALNSLVSKNLDHESYCSLKATRQVGLSGSAGVLDFDKRTLRNIFRDRPRFPAIVIKSRSHIMIRLVPFGVRSTTLEAEFPFKMLADLPQDCGG